MEANLKTIRRLDYYDAAARRDHGEVLIEGRASSYLSACEKFLTMMECAEQAEFWAIVPLDGPNRVRRRLRPHRAGRSLR